MVGIMNTQPVTLTFHGAARTVTGSCMELAAGGKRFLIDCGLFQGSRSLEELNFKPLGFDPAQIDGLLLTHAHIDHCGLIPRLVAEGFTGPIWCTEPTRDLLGFTLPDSGRIQEYEAERKNRRNSQRGMKLIEPLYTEQDANRAVQFCRLVDLEQWIEIGGGVRMRYWNAGHILGSASIEVLADGVKLLFSGDIGPDEKAFYPDPQSPAGLDYVITESTYGDRDKPEVTLEQRRDALETLVEEALARGGNLIIPAFAIERTQEMVLDLAVLMNRGRLAKTNVFIDSPLASRATSVFRKHSHELEDMGDSDVFRHPNIHYVESAQQSMQLNKMTGAIIVAASGMCEAGRIRHHLRHNLWRPDSTVLFVGYQAEGSLGRVLLDGAKRVRISGEEVAVRAQIRRIDNYSAHADKQELINWVKERLPISGGVFLTHGEDKAMATHAASLVALGLAENRVIRPQLGEAYRLVPGAVASLAHAAQPEAESRIGPDWRNDYSAMRLELEDQLRAMKSDADRRNLLARLKKTLASLER
jgi:metallo-beta-lactamase family protein